MPDFTEEEIDAAFLGYVQCALWTSTDDDGDFLDAGFGVEDLTSGALSEMRADVADFLNRHASAVLAFQTVTSRCFDQIGSDFWLTRNRHGAGFWDRDAGEVGERLSDAAEAAGERWLYVSEDGMISLT